MRNQKFKAIESYIDEVEDDDNVDHPEHYTQGDVECFDALKSALDESELRGYLKGNILKYVWREQHKNGLEDLKKAAWYLEQLIEFAGDDE